MRRMLLIAVCLVGGGLLLASGPSESDDSYTVRAVFDNASFAAEGEDVKVAGAVVGEIDSMDVGENKKAILNLRIEDDEFVPFHADARCSIRSEGVLAVKFVECDPGSESRPALEQVQSGDGAGSYTLPVGRTQSPIDLDIVQRIYRRPTGQQLAILLSELGTGLAGRGDDLNAAIRRANPSLRQTDRVLQILASENRQLAAMARDADAVLGPLAAEQERIAGFVRSANQTYQSTAARSEALAEGIERLPRFLRELRPAMADLGRLAGDARPVLAQLRGAAPGLNRATKHLPRFAKEGVPAFRSLGRFADEAGPDLLRSEDLIADLGDLGGELKPSANKLDELTASIERQDGLENFAGLLFGGASAVNGFDSAGHYAKVEFLSGACSEYTASGFFGCDAQWGPTEESAGPITEGASASGGKSRTKVGVKPGATLLEYLLGEGK